MGKIIVISRYFAMIPEDDC